MAGHSKWANIQHRKGRQDEKRGKIWTRIVREITVAARQGGGDPRMNPRLRLAVDKATENNMPKDNIERAIKKGTGGGEAVNFEDLTYEIYAPGGVAVLAGKPVKVGSQTGRQTSCPEGGPTTLKGGA